MFDHIVPGTQGGSSEVTRVTLYGQTSVVRGAALKRCCGPMNGPTIGPMNGPTDRRMDEWTKVDDPVERLRKTMLGCGAGVFLSLAVRRDGGKTGEDAQLSLHSKLFHLSQPTKVRIHHFRASVEPLLERKTTNEYRPTYRR